MIFCPCGETLHYTDFAAKKLVERLIAEKGEFVIVHCAGKRYLVSRHYLALHGLKGWEMDELARRGHIEAMPPESEDEEVPVEKI